MRFIVHFTEQTIEVDDHDGHCLDKESAEFFASPRVIADKIEVEL
jgi:hypothetical protein